ncbi:MULTISPECIES: alpha/beta hydrolase [Commensalibacter]|uniref:alpha/beta hydrolase n=1 Tax=Commensalibacter TaxID=1079922 RepID=UPI001268D677
MFISHSLGCVSVLNFVNKSCKEIDRIGGYILVSGFTEPLETLPFLKRHTDSKLDYKALLSFT